MKSSAWIRIAGLAACVAFALPVTAQFKPSMQQQIELGQKAADQIRKEEKVLPASDPRVIEVRRIGDRLVELLPSKDGKRKPFRYSFDVIESRELNAFALPGGPIFIYTGLLDNLATEDMLAAILGHEMIHVQNEHWASAYADNQKRRLGLALLLGLIRANDTVFNLASVSDQLLFQLPYSRRHEHESDDQGLDIIVRAGYNPQGVVDVFTLLSKSGGGARGMEWISTHPDSQNRIKRVQERIRKLDRTFPAQRARPNYKGDSTKG